VSQVKTNATNTDSLEGKAYTVHVGKTYTYPLPPSTTRDVRGIPQKYFPLFCLLPPLILSAILFSYHTALSSCVERHEALATTHASILDRFYLFPKDPSQ
jgi:hypothetical protein